MSDVTQLNNSDILYDIYGKFNSLVTEWIDFQENLIAYANNPANLLINIKAGSFSLGKRLTTLSSPLVVDLSSYLPTTNPKIIVVTLKDDDDGDVDIIEGVEATSPTAPTYTLDRLPICEITLTVGMTQINDSDITDVRPWLNISRDALAIDGDAIDNSSKSNGYVMYYDTSSSTIKWGSVSGLGSITIAWLDLTDTDSSYTGKEGYIPKVNSTPDGLELVDPDTLGYVKETELYSKATFQDFKRRTIIHNPTFSGWAYSGQTPYHLQPISWVCGGSAGITTADGYRGLGCEVPETHEIVQWLSDDLVDDIKGNSIFMQGLAKGNGYLRLEIEEDDTTTTNYDETFTNASAYSSLSKQISIPSTANHIRIIGHSSSGNSIFDNIHLGFQKRNPNNIFENYIRGKQLEFGYFDTTNPPDEGIQDKAPAIYMKSTGTSTFYNSYQISEDYPGYSDLMLGILAKPEDALEGKVKLRIQVEVHAGIGHSKTINSIDIYRYIKFDDSTNYKYTGIRLELNAEPTADMNFHIAISRLADDAEDTFNGKIAYIMSTEIIPIAKDYTT